MSQIALEGSRVALVRSLIEIGAIRFPANPVGLVPVSLNFRPKDTAFRSGPLTAEHMRSIGEAMISSADAQICEDCQAAVGIPYPDYPQRWTAEGSPLVFAFARRWRGMTPLGFHQVKEKASSEEVYKVVVVDTFPRGTLDWMDEEIKKIDTLCGLSVQVVGAMTFLRNDDQETLGGRPLSSMFTPTTLLEFCHQRKLVPRERREAIDHYLRTLH